MSVPTFNRATTQLSITVNAVLYHVVQRLSTPQGMTARPKGTDSQLISQLLEKWVQEATGADSMEVFEIMEILNHQNLSLERIKAAIKKSKEIQQELQTSGETA